MEDEEAGELNSVASSAIFISMTNNIKMFKSKVKSLNTPTELCALTLVFVLILLILAAGTFLEIFKLSENLDYY